MRYTQPLETPVFSEILSKSPVRLLKDLPELSLRAGDLGVVRTSWHFPTVAYEVEFSGQGPTRPQRVLLLEDHVQLADQTTVGYGMDASRN